MTSGWGSNLSERQRLYPHQAGIGELPVKSQGARILDTGPLSQCLHSATAAGKRPSPTRHWTAVAVCQQSIFYKQAKGRAVVCRPPERGNYTRARRIKSETAMEDTGSAPSTNSSVTVKKKKQNIPANHTYRIRDNLLKRHNLAYCVLTQPYEIIAIASTLRWYVWMEREVVPDTELRGRLGSETSEGSVLASRLSRPSRRT